MGDLQQVDAWQSAGQEQRVDPLLDIAGQQEAPSPDLPEQHDRDVVDGGAPVARALRHLTRIGPHDRETNLINREAIPG
jgi:hypothetical protein